MVDCPSETMSQVYNDGFICCDLIIGKEDILCHLWEPWYESIAEVGMS